MDFAKTILGIRNEAGLTQEEFAEKLHVTRQAVSRWENGETTPTLDSIKLMVNEFNVDANIFFKEPAICQSCGWTLKDFDVLGTNEDKGLNHEYCAHCFVDGKYAYDVSIEEIIESLLETLEYFNADSGTNFTKEQAHAMLTEYLPTLKRWEKV
ncbi:MAG: helix-turn-helix domain-containing protein [Firmicutes bacterium]|nr:helix-turn-helix domain-containing protein [Bacillota bacterium]